MIVAVSRFWLNTRRNSRSLRCAAKTSETFDPSVRSRKITRGPVVEDRADQFHLHALAERESADLGLEMALDVEELGQSFQTLPIVALRDFVDTPPPPPPPPPPPEKRESIERREIPPELSLLSHDERDLPPEVERAFEGFLPKHASVARWLGEIRPERIFSKVVFPAPFAPIKPLNEPGFDRRSWHAFERVDAPRTWDAKQEARSLLSALRLFLRNEERRTSADFNDLGEGEELMARIGQSSSVQSEMIKRRGAENGRSPVRP